LSSAALEMVGIDTLFEGVRKTAGRQGFELLVGNALDLLQCRASFLRDTNGLIRIFIHVPMADPEAGRMEVFRFVPFPMQVSSESFMHIDVQKKIIAISKTQKTFRILDTDELASCTRVGSTFLCENGNVVRKPREDVTGVDEEQCLYWLFLQHFVNVKRMCPASITGITERLQQIGQDRFIASTSHPHSGTVTCPQGRTSESLSMRATSVHRIHPGCKVETATHIFLAGIALHQEDKRARDNAFNWPFPQALAMLAGVDPMQLDEWRGTPSEDLFDEPIPSSIKDIQQWETDQIRRLHTTRTSNFLIYGVIGLSAVITIVVGAGTAAFFFIRGRAGRDFIRSHLQLSRADPEKMVELLHNIKPAKTITTAEDKSKNSSLYTFLPYT